jgi:hypothetical protein
MIFSLVKGPEHPVAVHVQLALTTPLVLHLIEVRAYADGAVLHVYRPAAG